MPTDENGLLIQKHNQILIGRSDTKSRTQLTRALKEKGFHVEAVSSAQDALELLESRPITLTFIDLPMVNMHDCEFMQNIRHIRPETLIVVRYKQPTIESAVAAIKVGAADYLIGPPDTHEDVQAVVSALGKRAEQIEGLVDDFVRGAKAYLTGENRLSQVTRDVEMPAQSTVVAGDLSLYIPTRNLSSVSKPERSVQLTDGEFQILFTLMHQPKKAMSCRAILMEARGFDVLEIEAKSLVRPYITRIRHKLREAQINPQAIQTVRTVGYIFEPSFATQNSVDTIQSELSS